MQRSLRVAAYCRVSTDKDEQQNSYEAQKSFYTDKIMQNPEWQMAGIHADAGISGTMATKRPNFMRMIRDCKKRKIDLILTKPVQRFARNTLDSLEHVRLLKSMGIGVIFETQGLDTRKMSNEFMLTMYASMAQNESENISTNVKWGRQRSFAKGKVSISYGSFLGYRRGADGQPEVVPEEAAVVTQIYNDFLSGKTRQQIANTLTAQGTPTPMGKTVWTASTVHSILRNEKYVGDALLQKTYVSDCLNHISKVNNGELPQYYVENNHLAIIDGPTWNRVQEELARRGGKQKVKEVGTKTEQGKYSSKFALTELLLCGECGTPYRRCTWSKNGKKKVVWRCISRLDYGKKYCKHSPTLEESVVQEAILTEISKIARMQPQAWEILKQQIGMGLSGEFNNGDDPYAIQIRLLEIDQAVNEMIAMESQGAGDYESQCEALYGEKNALKQKLAQLKSDSAHASAAEAEREEIFAATDDLRNRPLTWDDQIIRQLIDCVKVVSKEKLIIRFRWGG